MVNMKRAPQRTTKKRNLMILTMNVTKIAIVIFQAIELPAFEIILRLTLEKKTKTLYPAFEGARFFQ